jgi:hypothetical protein
MNVKLAWIWFCVLGAGLALQASAIAANGEELSPRQLLKPAELTQEELAYYNKLTDPNAEKAFIVTRSWEHLCQQVIDRKLPAIQLPDKPATFSARYLLPAEPVVINRALAANIIANACKGKPSSCASQYRGIVEMSAAQILTPAQLTQAEQDYYGKLTDPVLAGNFIKTRSYARLCQQVVDHKMPAEQLPDKPLGFTNAYLLPGEEAVVNSAATASLTALCTDKSKHCF